MLLALCDGFRKQPRGGLRRLLKRPLAPNECINLPKPGAWLTPIVHCDWHCQTMLLVWWESNRATLHFRI